MCGRYGFVPPSKEQFAKRFGIKNLTVNLEKRYNISPGSIMPVVVRQSPNQVKLMKWGLVPFWAKDPSIGFKMINARVEIVAVKPSFRKAIESQRCLVPASFFFECKKTGNEKNPYLIKLKNNEMFSFAGIFDNWKDAEGRKIQTYTIITTEPNSKITETHNRMPIILNSYDEDLWLDKSAPIYKITGLLKACQNEISTISPVSKLVNKPENDSDEVIKQSYSLYDNF